MRYELESSLPYPHQLHEDRRQEIGQARAFNEALTPLLARPGKCAQELETLLSRIKQHLDSAPPTPYREAVVQVQRQAEALQRGDLPSPIIAAKYVETEPAPATTAVLGGQTPDFTAPVFGSNQPEHFRRWHGKPILMVFYQPKSITATEVLQFAQSIQNMGHDAVVVLGMAMSQDAPEVLKQRDALRVTFPLLDGTGLRQSYDVEATPKVLVIDASGVVRGVYTGWGHEVPKTVLDELRRCLAQPASPR
jgi:hypothetical protein